MPFLAVAFLLWTGCHIGIAGTSARAALVSRIGENGFRIAFSIASVVTIGLLIAAYSKAPYIALWDTPPWLGWLLVLAMLPAFILFVVSILARNPTAVGQEGALRQDPRGIVRITRHPMLWSFALWAGVHILGNGDLASLLFFGAFLITALAGMPSIDTKVAARDRDGWQRFSALTSILPFAALIAGRNHPVWSEIGWLPPLIGGVLWVALLFAHPWVIGVGALPRG
jgi:uncharacterized membrane protein